MKNEYLTLIIVCLNTVLAVIYFDINAGEAVLFSVLGSLILLPFTMMEGLAILTIGSILYNFIQRYKIRNKHFETV